MPDVEVVVAAPITIEVVDSGATVEVIASGAVTAVEVVGVGPQGAKGDDGAAASTYLHTQSVASATWTINHNLGVNPVVSLYTVGGVEFDGQVTHITANQAVVSLVTSVAGFARCI